MDAEEWGLRIANCEINRRWRQRSAEDAERCFSSLLLAGIGRGHYDFSREK